VTEESSRIHEAAHTSGPELSNPDSEKGGGSVHLNPLSARTLYAKKFVSIKVRNFMTCIFLLLAAAFCMGLIVRGEPESSFLKGPVAIIIYISLAVVVIISFVASCADELRTLTIWIRCPNPDCGKGISTRLEWACGVCDAANTLPSKFADVFDFEKHYSFVNQCGTCRDMPASVLCCHCGDRVVLVKSGDHRHPARPAKLDERQEQSQLKQGRERKKLAEEVAKQQRDHLEEIKLRTETNKLLIVDAVVLRKRREAYLLAYPWLAEAKTDPDKVMEKIVNEVVRGEMIVFRVLRSLLESVTEELKRDGVDDLEIERLKLRIKQKVLMASERTQKK